MQFVLSIKGLAQAFKETASMVYLKLGVALFAVTLTFSMSDTALAQQKLDKDDPRKLLEEGAKFDWFKAFKDLLGWIVGNLKGIGIALAIVVSIAALVMAVVTSRNSDKSSGWMQTALKSAIIAAIILWIGVIGGTFLLSPDEVKAK